MQIELTDEEAALCIIGVGRSLQEIQMLAKSALEGSEKRKPIWTPEMKRAASRSGKLLKKLVASLAQSREAHNDKLTDAAPPSGIETKTDATGRRSRAATC